jgi:hypothetical protein
MELIFIPSLSLLQGKGQFPFAAFQMQKSVEDLTFIGKNVE